MKKFRKLATAALALGIIIPQATPTITYAEVMNKDVVKLRLLETTDLHANMMNYDYYQDKEVANFGLAKTATLVKQAKKEAKNSLLFDNGDLIQGSPLGDYIAKVDKLEKGEVHPVYKVMNQLGYDAGNLGNHEFNYGLEFLDKTLKGAAFPYVNANVYVDDKDQDESNDKNMFKPYVILDKEVVGEDGEKHKIKVGVIGFVPPQITQWDSARIGGQVIAKDIVETAKKFVPEMKKQGADLIVAIPHSGIDANANGKNEENAVYNLSKVEGISAILFGHSHQVFPSDKYKDVAGADLEKGTLNGVPTVQAGMWGDNLGLIDLTIEKKDDKWSITDSKSSTRQIYVKEGADNKSTVETDQGAVDAIKREHKATIEYMKGALGKSTAPINSYFSQVKDNESMQVVNQAQKWYVEKNIQGTPYEKLPVLSAAAPFKAGTRDNPNYYTDIPAGTLQLKNAADIYLYDNNAVFAVVVTGAQIKEWLEMAAGQFNQIKTDTKEEQNLINTDYRSYNYDVIDGITYEIDVTQPAKYDVKGLVVNKDANRIVNVKYSGKEIDGTQKFIVATNDYRATSQYPGLPGSEIIVKSPESSREVVANYTVEKGTIDPTPDMNWSFKAIDEDVNVVFESSPEGQKYIKATDNFKYVATLPTGFAKYAIDMKAKTENVTGQAFKDVTENHWAYAYITELVSLGIINGKSADTFDPNGVITNDQFVSILIKALKLEEGIVPGTSKDTIDPNAPINREQMAEMIVRAYEVKTGKKYVAKQSATFKDESEISASAKEYVNAAYELGLMVGSNGKFNAKANVTRAQAAKVVTVLLKK